VRLVVEVTPALPVTPVPAAVVTPVLLRLRPAAIAVPLPARAAVVAAVAASDR